MTAHTSGPWTIEPTTLEICRLIVTTEDVACDEIISASHTVAYVPTDYATEEQHANACLIAAAPDLLKALKEVVRLSDRNANEWYRAHAAIAKAEGRNE